MQRPRIDDPAVAYFGSSRRKRRAIRPGAYAMCLDQRGRILLCRLAASEAEAGVWTLPGGAVEFGERPEATVLRELAEETGQRGEIETIAGVYSHVWDESPYARWGPLHHVGIVYRVRVHAARLRFEHRGSSDRAAWVPRGEIATLPIGPLLEAALGMIEDPGAAARAAAIER